ncbi:MAG TPA: DUF1801 domain-containing protein [Vicinamibacterales bacterium]
MAKPTTVKEYLESLPDPQRKTVETVRKVILKHLPKGYKESVGYGVLTYGIPLEVFPDTYNKQPLAIACLAAQKNYNSLYLMGAYGDPKQRKALEDGFKKAGKKLDMGKSCVRFKSVDDLPMDTIAKAIAAVPPDKYIKIYEASRARKASR